MNPLLMGAIANIVGGVAGNVLSQGDRDAANDQIKQITDLYANLKTPDIEQMKVDLQDYATGPSYTAKEDTAEQLAMSDALQNIQLDPRLKQTQMNALETLNKIAGSGFTPDELNALQEQRSAREGDLTSKLKAIQQQQEMRGVANSDMGIAQKMMEAQSSSNRGAADARALEAEAFKRSLQAITQGSDLAGQIDNTDYARQANLAQNLNQRELTNLQQRAGVNASNVDRFNDALRMNISRQQGVSDKNVDLSNNQQQYNKQLLQQDFQNQQAKVAGLAGAKNAQAQQYQNNANATAGMFQGIGAGAGTALMGMGGTTTQDTAKNSVNLNQDTKPKSYLRF